MVSSPTPSEPIDAAAEHAAAGWVARLQRPDRGPEVDAALRAWLDARPENAAAFAEATQVWEELGGVGAAYLARERGQAARRRRMAAGIVALAAAAALAVFVTVGRDSVYSTPVGGREVVRLADGSTVTLNTDTRLRVRFTRFKRSVRLERGEAYFKVAKNPARPFVVASQASAVKAIGTAFVVRQTGRDGGVTLFEGKVMVTPEHGLFDRQAAARPVVLYPGQQWRAGDGQVVKLSGTALEAAAAWRSGKVMMDDVSLADAANELNRYSDTPILIETENAARLRVSGVFDARDGRSFARTVAAIYGLRVAAQPGRIVIAGAPAETAQ